MARVNTFLTVACPPRRATREMRDSSVLTLAHLQDRRVSKKERMRVSAPSPSRVMTVLGGLWRRAVRKRTLPRPVTQPAGLAFRTAKLGTNADNSGFGTTTR